MLCWGIEAVTESGETVVSQGVHWFNEWAVKLKSCGPKCSVFFLP